MSPKTVNVLSAYIYTLKVVTEVATYLHLLLGIMFSSGSQNGEYLTALWGHFAETLKKL